MPAGILPNNRALNAFAGVSPRYLEPVHRQQPNYVPPQPERYDTQRQWQGASSRYLTNVSSAEQQKLREERQLREAQLGAERKDPLGGYEQRDLHREYTKRHGLDGVSARYEVDAQAKGHPEVTPRDLVKKRDDVEKLEKLWRGTHALNHYTTFDSLYKKRLKAHPEDDPKNWKKNKARSPVADYFRHGTPIQSASRNGIPGSGGALSFVKNDTSGRSNSAQIRRAQSPWERNADPEKIGDRPQWRSGGVSLASFQDLRKQTMAANKHFREAEEAAAKAIERQNSSRVDGAFVPRVATLALAYQLPGFTPASPNASRNNSPAASRRATSPSPSETKKSSPTRRNTSPERKNNNNQSVSHLQPKNSKPKTSSSTTTSPIKKKSYNIGTDNDDEKESPRNKKAVSSDEETEIGKN
jgi:hypothetical protein